MHETLQELEGSLTAALTGLTAAQTQIRPDSDPKRWSIQQIAEHLMLSYSSSSAVVETRIAKGTPTKASPSLQQRLAQFSIISLGRFPSGRKAPPAVDPVAVGPTAPRSGAALEQEATAGSPTSTLWRAPRKRYSAPAGRSATSCLAL